MNIGTLKPGWKMVKFGDIAENVTVRVDPADAKTDVYVGLEHLDPSTIHLRQWGHPSDVTGQKLAFKKGDVIFGRRRAYQRKLAVAEFDGICSAHAMVVRAKPKMILPEFLPFFLQSDMFMERAIEISVGSLSPTINWKTLKVQEFPLPPIDEQKRIAEILWAADEAVECAATALDQSTFFEKRLLLHLFENSGNWPSKRISEVGDVQLGRQRAPKYTTGKYTKPYLRVVNVLDGKLDFSDVEEMDFDERDFERYRLSDGDILITEGDITSPYNVGRNAVYHNEIDRCCFQNTLIRMRCHDGLMPDYASACFRYMLYKGVFAGVANTTTVTHLGGTRFASMRMPIPDSEKQYKIVEQVHSARAQMTQAENHVAQTKALLKALRETLILGVEAAHV